MADKKGFWVDEVWHNLWCLGRWYQKTALVLGYILMAYLIFCIILFIVAFCVGVTLAAAGVV